MTGLTNRRPPTPGPPLPQRHTHAVPPSQSAQTRPQTHTRTHTHVRAHAQLHNQVLHHMLALQAPATETEAQTRTLKRHRSADQSLSRRQRHTLLWAREKAREGSLAEGEGKGGGGRSLVEGEGAAFPPRAVAGRLRRAGSSLVRATLRATGTPSLRARDAVSHSGRKRRRRSPWPKAAVGRSRPAPGKPGVSAAWH